MTPRDLLLDYDSTTPHTLLNYAVGDDNDNDNSNNVSTTASTGMMSSTIRINGSDNSDNSIIWENANVNASQMMLCQPCLSQPPQYKRLGIVLDLDGTLILEEDAAADDDDDSDSEHEDEEDDSDDEDSCFEGQQPPAAPEKQPFLRPGAIEFLLWCKSRGHALAVWTAGHASWANYVSYKLCTAMDELEQKRLNTDGGESSAQQDVTSCHECTGSSCPKHFEFVWNRDRLRQTKRLPVATHGMSGADDCCRWCGEYGRYCNRCSCHVSARDGGGIFKCPCRYTKDLTKVWKYKIEPFTRSRTILVENTPQQCVRNYGNGVYIPTYCDSDVKPIAAEEQLFERLKGLVLQLERLDDVRAVHKCNCYDGVDEKTGKNKKHACLQQSWWTEDLSSPPAQDVVVDDDSDNTREGAPESDEGIDSPGACTMSKKASSVFSNESCTSTATTASSTNSSDSSTGTITTSCVLLSENISFQEDDDECGGVDIAGGKSTCHRYPSYCSPIDELNDAVVIGGPAAVTAL